MYWNLAIPFSTQPLVTVDQHFTYLYSLNVHYKVLGFCLNSSFSITENTLPCL